MPKNLLIGVKNCR